MFRRLNKAQSTAEYAILIGLVIGAVFAMQIYVRRGLQGRIRDVVAHTGAGGTVGDASFAFTGKQYEPYETSSAAASESTRPEKETVEVGGKVVRALEGAGETSRVARKTVVGWEGEDVQEPGLPE